MKELTYVIEDKLFGQFADQHNTDVQMTIIDAARQYVADSRGADVVLFALPIIEKGASRNGAGHSRVYVGLFTQGQVLRALDDLAAGKRNALKLDGTIKLARAEKLTMRQTFGAPVATFLTNVTSVSDIVAQVSTKGAKFSTKGRAWEAVVQETLKARGLKVHYIGSLKAGKTDLTQKGDHVVTTAIPPTFW